MLQFINSGRFIASSLSNFVNNLSEGIHRIKCKFGHDDKKYETWEVKYKHCNCFLEYTNLCFCCNKSYQRKFDKKLKERFFKTYKFLTTTIISFFYYCKRVFILMNIWMIEKRSIKNHYLKKILQSLEYGRYY